MNRSIQLTSDGSHTYYNADLGEPYHSLNGAITESEHVFIKNGLKACSKRDIRILEIGFGTGLNLLLTMKHTLSEERRVYYHAVDKFPLSKVEYTQLNYCSIIGKDLSPYFQKAHETDWNTQTELTGAFTLFKELADFREMDPPAGFDIIYFDAFSPSRQPELWSPSIVKKCFDLLNQSGIWVSYTVKGSVRRDLQSVGFKTEKLPGPPGKLEMLRGLKP